VVERPFLEVSMSDLLRASQPSDDAMADNAAQSDVCELLVSISQKNAADVDDTDDDEC
jgi:hypothetical protein